MTGDDPRRRRPWRRVFRGLLVAMVSLFLLALVVRSVWGFVSARQLRNEIAKIRSVGEPVTFKDLDADLARIDPADDAARQYRAALALLGSLDHAPQRAYKEAVSTWPVTQPDDELQDQVRQLLSQNRLAFDLIDQAAALPECQFNSNVRHGIAAVLERLGEARRAAVLVSLRTHALALGGNSDAAVDSVIGSLKMLRIFDREPVIITHLTRMSCAAIACYDTVTVLELTDPSDKALVRLDEALSLADWPNLLPRSILCERVLGIMMQRNLIAGAAGIEWNEDETARMPGQFGAGYGSRPFMRSMSVGYLRDMGKFVEAAKNPWPQVVDTVNGVVASGVLSRNTIIPALKSMVSMMGRSLAIARSTGVAVMIERYRQAHGVLPNMLSDLTVLVHGPFSMDPFTGQDLKYLVNGDSYVVYSFGNDRKDDGGLVDLEKGQTPRDWGIRIRFSRPEE